MLAFACFFLSGVAGLIAEICWIRRAALAFGSTIYALSTVLAVFFAGLAIGGLLFGERSPRIDRPLRLYALLELALALLVLATMPLFDLTEAIFGLVYQSFDALGVTVALARCVLVAVVVLPPAIIMGGTLPLFCRQFVATEAHVGRTVALLYGINTLGAAVGAAWCGFILLPQLGMQSSLLIAAVLELAAGGLGVFAGWHRTAPSAVPAQHTHARARARTTTPAPSLGPIAFIFFIAGFVALGNEVLWTRFLALVTRTTVFTYTLSLSVTLSGIACGTSLMALVTDRIINRARLLGALQALVATLAVSIPLLPPRTWERMGQLAHAFLLFPPALLSGAILPLAVRMVVRDPILAGTAVGRLVAVNTAGGIVGSLAVGFIALPRFGLQTTLLCTSACALVGALIAWWQLDRATPVPVRAALSAVAVLAWLLLPGALGTQIPRDYLAEPGALVDYREGRESNLAVVQRRDALHLEADRWWQGRDRPTHQMLAAHIPLVLHGSPERVLVVGVGAGQTPANVLAHDVDALDCIDIEPAAFDLIRSHFDSAWLDDPRVRLLREDGRSYVAHTAARYDVISLELGQLFRPGIADFYTADFYRLARARLLPNGILSQFVPLPFLSPAAFRSVVATFTDVFPHSVLWYNTSELLLLGINADRIAIRPDRLHLLTAQPRVNAALRYSYWGGPAYWLNQPHVFLAGFLTGPRALAALAHDAPIERDDHPTLAYASRTSSELDTNERQIVELLRAHLESVATIMQSPPPPHTVAAIARVRERNLDDIAASALLRRVDALVARQDGAALAALFEQARQANPDNVQVYRLAGDFAFYRGNAAEAETQYRQALQHDPDEPGSHLGLARLLHAQGRPAEAIAHYRAALAQRRGDSQTYIAFGGARAATGDVAGAEQSFRDALAVDPRSADAHNNLAVALSQRGDIAGARQHLETALRLRPDYAEARQNLARLKAKEGR